MSPCYPSSSPSVPLSLLRTGRLPSSFSSAFDLDDLLAKARFYGLDPDFLLSPFSDPSLFDPFALRRSLALPIPGRDRPSAISAAPSGSLLVAHGSKITAFDPALRRRATVLTRFPAVDSLLALSPSLAAAGATDFPRLQLLDLSLAGCVAHALHWFPLPATATTSSSATAGATVQAIGASPDLLFGSFESCRRNRAEVGAEREAVEGDGGDAGALAVDAGERGAWVSVGPPAREGLRVGKRALEGDKNLQIPRRRCSCWAK